MPTIPRLRSEAPAPALTPRVGSFSVSADDFGAGVGNALRQAGSDVFHASTDAMRTDQRRRDRDEAAYDRLMEQADSDEADKALTAYQSELAAALHGTTDPDGNPVPGIVHRQAAAATGSAADFARTEKEWFNRENGPYVSLRPEARRLFESRARGYSERLRAQAAQHELSQLDVQRGLDRAAAELSADRTARTSYGTPDFEPFAGEAALRRADAALKGRARLNPDGSRAFASPADEQLHRDLSAAALADLRHDQAQHFVSQAEALAADPSADTAHDALLARARAEAAVLPPELADRVKAAADAADRTRSARLKAAEADARADRLEAVRKAEAAAPAIYQDWIASSDGPPVSAERALAALHEAARQAPEEARPAFTAYMERVNGVIAARERDQQEAAKAAGDKAEKARLESLKAMNRANVENLVSGYAMIDGRLARLPEDDIEAIAYALLTDPAEHITSEDHARIAKSVETRRDARASEFTDAIARDVLPQFEAAYRALPAFSFDTDTDTVTPNKAKPPAKSRALTPGTPARITRADPVDATGRKQILLADLLEAANATAARLRADPAMTPQQARERFDALTRGTLSEYRGLTLREAIGRDAALTDRIRRNAETYRLTGRRPPNP